MLSQVSALPIYPLSLAILSCLHLVLSFILLSFPPFSHPTSPCFPDRSSEQRQFRIQWGSTTCSASLKCLMIYSLSLAAWPRPGMSICGYKEGRNFSRERVVIDSSKLCHEVSNIIETTSYVVIYLCVFPVLYYRFFFHIFVFLYRIYFFPGHQVFPSCPLPFSN